ncbi:MAG: site-2 protease family protein [Acidobacteria bacterium]|nr:site-2 protease family protein [Acidobacteriota bacterium]
MASSADVRSPAPGASHCPACGCESPAARLLCPRCGALLHRRRLEELAAQATQAEAADRWGEAAGLWREALALLPPGSQQHQDVGRRAAEAARKAPASLLDQPPGGAGKMPKILGSLGAVGVALWKLKFVAVFLLTKAKFLLLGLSKGGTLLTMLLSFGVYWAAFGWWFAAGLVISIYIHEMGHVAALRRLGVKASAPMFVPGLGAVIRLREAPADSLEDAEVGLAGPIWGLGAAAACWAVFLATGSGAWGAIAKLGAWINLFNLLPFWQLDGARGFRALDRQQRWLAAAFVVCAFVLSGEGMLLLIAAVGAWNAWRSDATTPNWRILATYLGLIAALSWLAVRVVPMPT